MTNINKYSYFTANPWWKDNRLSSREKQRRGGFPGHFVGDASIVYKKFGTIEAALFAMKEDGTCLREISWDICGHTWFRHDAIPLAELHRLGYLANGIEKDSISFIYNFK